MLKWLYRRETRSYSGKLTIKAKSDTNVTITKLCKLRSKPATSSCQSRTTTNTTVEATASWLITAANPNRANIRVNWSWWITTLDPISNYFLRIRRPLTELAIASRILVADVWPNRFLEHECSADLSRSIRTLDARSALDAINVIDALNAAGPALRHQLAPLRIF